MMVGKIGNGSTSDANEHMGVFLFVSISVLGAYETNLLRDIPY